MDTSAQRQTIALAHVEQIREAKAILQEEAQAILSIAQQLDTNFCAAVDLVWNCAGSVIVTGMGKAGLIGQKLAATFSSTGTSAHFLHPAEAVHGDLGCLRDGDVVVMLSNSGETEEISRLLPMLERFSIPIIALTSQEDSTLGQAAEVVLKLGSLKEAGQLKLAPSTTTTAMLALGDALALVVSQLKNFTPQQFATYHPGGSLGQRLKIVGEVMRSGEQLRVASATQTIREVFTCWNHNGRRTGALILVDDQDCLAGIFTDSDLARLLEQHRESQFDRPISEVMTADPLTISESALLTEAVEVLSRHKVSELPVVNDANQPIGLIDITDIVGLVPVCVENS